VKVIKRINPGQPGTKKYHNIYGERLVCVRYRHNSEKNERITTIELVVDKGFSLPDAIRKEQQTPPNKNSLVKLHLEFHESELRVKVIKSDGEWINQKNAGRFNTTRH